MKLLIITLHLILLKSKVVYSWCPHNDVFDFVIVGAGATGCVIATRLTEKKSFSVLLLEAGGEPAANSSVPLLALDSELTPRDWNFTTTSQKHCCSWYKDNEVQLAQGKMLGGSASHNSMVYTRGNRKDYDTWKKLGNTGWGFDDVLPYFLKLEDYQIPHPFEDDQYHHTGGPITVTQASFETNASIAFINSGKELGQPVVDFNAATQTGFMYLPANVKNGARCSSYACYLVPNKNRRNLKIRINSFVIKVILNKNKRATGVEYLQDSKKCIAKARKEVIISGGAFNSPKLLMLSGIGNKDTLQQFKIRSVVDLPGVGQNLQDHPILDGQFYSVNQSVTLNSVRYQTKEYFDQWKANRTGPYTVPAAAGGVAFYQSEDINKTDYPDTEIYFVTDNPMNAFKYKSFVNPQPLLLPPASQDVVAFLLYVLRPKSHGYVTLRSKNPLDKPIIEPNYMSHPDDVDRMVKALKFSKQLAATNAFQQYGAQLLMDVLPDCKQYISISEDEYYKCLVKYFITPGLHPAGTCKMGPRSDPMAVVDDRLRVHKTTGLRVADASIMPNVPSGHTNVPCMMIGEKVSDMIKADN